MRIRSITSFYDPNSASAGQDLESLSIFSQKFLQEAEDHSFPVLSRRLATTPFPYYLDALSFEARAEKILEMDQTARLLGWDYLSLGPALPNHPWSFAEIPQMLTLADNLFCAGVISDDHFLYPHAVRAAARVIHDTAALSPDGFTNLRFAALANVAPGTPFFPAAYHSPGALPAVSLAIECADVAMEVFSGSLDLESSRKELIQKLEQSAFELNSLAAPLLQSRGIQFLGFDFSPAPFPEDWCSLAGAVESIGLEHIGGIGSLAAVAVIADTLDQGNWLRAGFNGMMLPVMEDSVLAQRADQSLLSVKDLLLYSTVCGTGLDTIPLPGEVTLEQLASILMDVGTLATRLGKPLTARLMPIPGKSTGDPVSFDFAYFAHSRVISVEGQSLIEPLNGDLPIALHPRKAARL